MKYVYILESPDFDHFYVGMTDDLRARLTKHNADAVPHTSKYKPWRLKPMSLSAMKNRLTISKNI